MNFLYDEQQRQLQHSTRGLVGRLGAQRPPREVWESATGLDEGAWRQGAELGWLSMLVPDELGGGSLTGQGLVDASALAEEWGRALQPGPLVSSNVVASALAGCGTPAQQGLLPDIVAGRATATWCAAEPIGGWDPDRIEVHARRRGGGWSLTGTKHLVEHADVADHLLVSARTDGGVGEWLVPAGTPGVTVTVQRTLDLTRRLCSVDFDGALLGAGTRLPGADLAAVGAQLDVAAVLVCADSVGGAERVLEMTVAYGRDRVQFGRAIASFQAVKHRCADLLVEVEGARAASRYAALSADEGRHDAALAVDLAKAHVGDAYVAVSGEGIQLHGGIGFTWDHDMHLFARRAKANAVLFGTPAWRRGRAARRLRALAAGEG